jgi:hypothetical protein
MHCINILLFQDLCLTGCKQHQPYINTERAISLQFMPMMQTHLFSVQLKTKIFLDMSPIYCQLNPVFPVSMSYVYSLCLELNHVL